MKLQNATKQFTLSTQVIKELNETLPYYTPAQQNPYCRRFIQKPRFANCTSSYGAFILSNDFFFLYAIFSPISPLDLFIEVSRLGVQGQ